MVLGSTSAKMFYDCMLSARCYMGCPDYIANIQTNAENGNAHTHDFFSLTICLGMLDFCLVPPLSSFLRVAAPPAREIVRRISNLILLDGRGSPKNW